MLTVTIPTTGRPKFLEDCINSIYDSTYVNLSQIRVVIVCCKEDDVSKEIKKRIHDGMNIESGFIKYTSKGVRI